MATFRPARVRVRRRDAGARPAALAAGVLALVLLGVLGSTANAVTSRTSEGVGLASPGPVASAPAAATPTTAPDAPRSDLPLVALGLVAAGGFGRGAWLLRGRRRGA